MHCHINRVAEVLAEIMRGIFVRFAPWISPLRREDAEPESGAVDARRIETCLSYIRIFGRHSAHTTCLYGVRRRKFRTEVERKRGVIGQIATRVRILKIHIELHIFSFDVVGSRSLYVVKVRNAEKVFCDLGLPLTQDDAIWTQR